MYLKLGEFDHSDAGQMNMCLNYFKDNESANGDNDPIGIILCSGKNETLVKYATMGLPHQGFQKMVKTVLQFDKGYKQILEISSANSIYHINTFAALFALDRIKWLMEFGPKLMKRVSNKLIASYLGINKDVFRRLKASLQKHRLRSSSVKFFDCCVPETSGNKTGIQLT